MVTRGARLARRAPLGLGVDGSGCYRLLPPPPPAPPRGAGVSGSDARPGKRAGWGGGMMQQRAAAHEWGARAARHQRESGTKTSRPHAPPPSVRVPPRARGANAAPRAAGSLSGGAAAAARLKTPERARGVRQRPIWGWRGAKKTRHGFLELGGRRNGVFVLTADGCLMARTRFASDPASLGAPRPSDTASDPSRSRALAQSCWRPRPHTASDCPRRSNLAHTLLHGKPKETENLGALPRRPSAISRAPSFSPISWGRHGK